MLSFSKKVVFYSFLLLSVLYSCQPKERTVETVPNPKATGGYVSNPDQLITSETVALLNAQLQQLDAAGKAQVAIVALGSIGDKNSKDFATDLFRYWQVGTKESRNGLLVLLVKDQRRIEFETGYGLEGELPDVTCFQIQQAYMVPYLKVNTIDSALLYGVQSISTLLTTGNYRLSGIKATRQAQLNPPQEGDELTEKSVGSSEENIHLLIIAAVLLLNSFFVGLFLFSKPKTAFGNSEGTAALQAILHKNRIGIRVGVILLPVLLIALAFLYAPFGRSVWIGLAVFYLSWSLLFFAYFLRLEVFIIQYTKAKDRTVAYRALAEAHKFLTIFCILFPLPMVVYAILYRFQLYRLRTRRYACEACGHTMRLLKEKEEDQHLQAAQLVEEDLKAIDYDVWVCTHCDNKRLLAYEKLFSQVETCPECHNKTFAIIKSEVQKQPTAMAKGWGRHYCECKFCNHTGKVKYMIEPVSNNDSFYSESSSSGTESSWGGGSSGGGGAGSSW